MGALARAPEKVGLDAFAQARFGELFDGLDNPQQKEKKRGRRRKKSHRAKSVGYVYPLSARNFPLRKKQKNNNNNNNKTGDARFGLGFGTHIFSAVLIDREMHGAE